MHCLMSVFDNRSISSLDTSGVALAAIKSLYQENNQLKINTHRALTRKDEQITVLQHQNTVLGQRLSIMEARLSEIDDLKQQLSAISEMVNLRQHTQGVAD